MEAGREMSPKEIFAKLTNDPGRLGLLAKVLENPRRALDTLDYLIRAVDTTPDSRRHYQQLRAALERYFLEVGAL